MTRITFLIALLAAFPPLSTDMYLPAIPQLQAEWNQPLMMVNLTLICFFLSYCLFLLIYGPVSDRFGRRRPLLVGIGIYVAASLMCGLAVDIYTLIAARIFQASGAAAAAVLSLAISKDLFEAEEREQIMAYIAIIMAFGPMCAPVIGGLIIHYSSWRLVFVLQAGMGILAWAGVYGMAEPLQHFQKLSARAAATVYFRLFGNRRFAGLMLALSILIFPLFGFIAAAPEIYMSGFGLDERQFGYLFGFNAVASLIGALFFTKLCRRFSSVAIMTTSFIGILAASGLLLFLPHSGPWSLALPMWVFTFFLGLNRPPSNNLMLEQVDHDVGAASSLIIFTFMTLGAVSMGVISLPWQDKIRVLGIMAASVGTITLVFWLRCHERFFRTKTQG
jgi:DHA1 family bicyclomycin/chloramphenicol resistance-like MFS transporter